MVAAPDLAPREGELHPTAPRQANAFSAGRPASTGGIQAPASFGISPDRVDACAGPADFYAAAPFFLRCMKTTPLLAAVILGTTALMPMKTNAKDEAKPATKTEKAAKKSKLNHVVAFKFKDSATKEQVKEVEDAFRALKTKIPQIQKLQWGLNNSPEGLNKGFTHCWVLTFESEADRDAYLVHPDHKEFGKGLKPILADVMVIDFWAKN
jgi:hypothetical protein